MAMKITCPHCKRGMMGPESLAGKKVRCKACQQILTVPNLPATPAPPPTPPASEDGRAPEKPKPAPAPPAKTKPAPAEKARIKPAGAAAPRVETPPAAPPPPPPADVEAEAAALFSDEPPPAEPTETRTIDLNCPYCDEAIHFSADLAGKRAPCPECKHILKVPELVKKEPKDWRKADPRGPAGARLPDQPAPEGAWASTGATRVGQKSLEEAGVIPQKKPPRTTWQKVRLPVLGVTMLMLLSVGGWMGYRWWGQRAADRALKQALDYAASPEAPREATPVGQAALAMGAGEYYLRTQESECVKPARAQFGKALTTLQAAPASADRDALLIDLALAWVEVGGDGEDVKKERRLKWDEVQKMLLPIFREIRDADAQHEALRSLARRLVERGQSDMIYRLTQQAAPSSGADRAATFAVAGLELLQANDRATAEKAADKAMEPYAAKEPPPLRAEVVALAVALQKKPPQPGEGPEDTRAERIGKAEGLARQEKWDEAGQQAGSKDLDDEARFRALLAIAAAAVDRKAADSSAVEAAVNAAESKVKNNGELSWAFLRLIRVALRAGMPEDRLLALASTIPNRALRGRAQLDVFRARLAGAKQVETADKVEGLEAASLARALASQALARHNTRLDSGWAAKVQEWPQPMKAFGALGVALGLQDRSRK